VTDGTAAGTRYVADVQPDGVGGYTHTVSVGDRAYFFSYPSPSRTADPAELWTSDGTAAGTRRLTSMPGPRIDELFTHDLVPWGAAGVLFDWPSEAGGLEPRVSDGTVAGTHPLGDLCPGECSSRRDRNYGPDYHVGRTLAYFAADDGVLPAADPEPESGGHGGEREL